MHARTSSPRKRGGDLRAGVEGRVSKVLSTFGAPPASPRVSRGMRQIAPGGERREGRRVHVAHRFRPARVSSASTWREAVEPDDVVEHESAARGGRPATSSTSRSPLPAAGRRSSCRNTRRRRSSRSVLERHCAREAGAIGPPTCARHSASSPKICGVIPRGARGRTDPFRPAREIGIVRSSEVDDEGRRPPSASARGRWRAWSRRARCAVAAALVSAQRLWPRP